MKLLEKILGPAVMILLFLVFVALTYFPTNDNVKLNKSPRTPAPSTIAREAYRAPATTIPFAKSNKPLVTAAPTATSREALVGALDVKSIGDEQSTALIDESIVYVTSSGTKYHRADCYTIANSPKVSEISREDAEAERYQPCKICSP